jgi:2-polyprenyl-6-methoxyphenol hydroxylase-like FAD-dependent oxidoreductase
MTVAVVGAGPAGLVAALAAARRGYRVECFEARTTLDERGAWLIGTAAQHALRSLGVSLQGRSCSTLTLCTDSLESLYRANYPRGKEARAVPRQLLLQQLHQLCLDAGVVFHLGVRLETPPVADVIIGADGCRSVVREWADLPCHERSLGHYYRGDLANSPVSSPIEIWTGDGRRFGIEPTLTGASFYCTAPARDPEDWCSYVQGWESALAREVLSLSHPTGLHRCTPLDIWCGRWYRPPYFLVGDAAHGQPPNLGQGANLGVLDSVCLIDQLAKNPDLQRVGSAYQVARSHFVHRLHALSVAACWFSHQKAWFRDRVMTLLNKFNFVKPWLLAQSSCETATKGWSYG